MKALRTKIDGDKGGKVSYERSVVAQIIELAAKEIAGVASLSASAGRAIKNIFSSKYKKGIFINFTEEGLETTIYLNALFGYAINEVSFRVQENIKKSVESMTEYKVKNINVIIVGVSFQAEESAYV